MAVDKLVDSAQLDTDLTSVANAIRTKGGTSAQMAFPAGFVSAVQAIPTGITPTGTKQITENGTYDVTQYASAEVNVSGGGGGSEDKWQRPSDYPNYDSVNLGTDNVLYMTCDTSLREPFMSMKFTGTNLVLERGSLTNGVFTPAATVPVTSGQVVTDALTHNSGYVVYRLTGNITQIASPMTTVTINGIYHDTRTHSLVEAYGRIPTLQSLNFRGMVHLRSITVKDATALTSIERLANESKCENVVITGITQKINCYYACGSCTTVRYFDLNGITVRPNRMESAFNGASSLKYCNAKWDLSGLTNSNMGSVFTGVQFAPDITTGTNSVVTSMSIMFRSSLITDIDFTDWDTSNVTNISYMFNDCDRLEEADFSALDFAKVTNTTALFEECSGIKVVKFPSSLTVVSTTTLKNTNSLQEVHFASTTPPTLANTNAFSGTSSTAVIYVPYSADHSILNAYKTATNWSTYASRMQEESA